MTRGRQDSDLELPFRVWTVTVDDKNRLRLPRQQVRAVVTWTGDTGPIQCVALPGSLGGIQVVPLDSYRQEVEPIASQLRQMSPSTSESSQNWVEVVRFLATACPITINIEPDRISITLPETMRLLGQVPGAGKVAVVFGSGEILEIWDSVTWNDRVRETAKKKAAAISAALEDLGKR